jgi:hypothetical protein
MMKLLPVHWAIRINANTNRVIELIETHRSTLHFSDDLNHSALDNALLYNAENQIILELLKHSLPIDPETKEAIHPALHEYAW